MSNGGDVLDNWEEIDEDVLNASEQILKIPSASSESITKTIDHAPSSAVNTKSLSTPTEMKVLQRYNTEEPTAKTLNKSPLDDMSATFQPVMMVLHKPQDEYQSANYTGPIANQTVKILRRPTQSNEIRNNGIRPKQPIKTLQQREQEYAEARLRILGSAKNPEDEELRTSTATITSVATSTSGATPSTTTSTISLSNNYVANITTHAKLNSPKIQVVTNQHNDMQNQQLQQQQKFKQKYQQQQHQQQNYFYNQQQQLPQSPTYNNNRTYNVNPLLTLGPMGAIGQPAQYQTTILTSPQTQQQHLKYQQYHQKSSQQQHKSQQQQQQTWSPVVGGSVSSSSIRQQQNDTLIRVPRGPDGSTGFQMHR